MTSNKAIFGRLAALVCLAAVSAGCGRDAAVSEEKLQKIASLQQRLTELQAEASKVEDASAIKRLQRAYGYYLDKAQWDEIVDLFADDGTIEIGLDGVYAGKERIRKYLYALGGGQAGLREGQLNEHMQLQPFVTVAEDGLSAKARWRAFIMAGQHGKNALWGEGPYENEYVKQDGVWKIKKLHWYQTFLVPYSGGWAKNKDVNGAIYVSKELPPDSPPSKKYDTWPGIYMPPFHFKNPGSGGAQ
jgi:hypothetical protein